MFCSCRRKDLPKACEFQAWFSMRCNCRQRTSQSLWGWGTEWWLWGASLLFLLDWALRGGAHGNELAVPPITNWSREPYTFYLWYHLPRKPTATKRCEESHDTRHLLGRATHLHTVTLQCRLTQGLIPLLCTHGAECTWIRPCISGRSTYCPIFKLEVLRDFVFTFQVYQHQNCVLSQIRHTCLQKNELSFLSGRKCKGVKRYYLPNLLKRVIWINWKLTRND